MRNNGVSGTSIGHRRTFGTILITKRRIPKYDFQGETEYPRYKVVKMTIGASDS